MKAPKLHSLNFSELRTVTGTKEITICWNDVTSIERDFKEGEKVDGVQTDGRPNIVRYVVQDYSILRFGTGEKLHVNVQYQEAVEKWKAARTK